MDIVNVINTLGFPIACVVGMAYFIYKIWNKQTAIAQTQLNEIISSNKAREDKLYQQIDKFNDTMANFNATLIRIDTRLGVLEKALNNDEKHDNINADDVCS